MATWGLVLAVVLAGAGCSDDGDDAEDDGPTTTEEAVTTAATASPCPLVTTEAVSEAFGLPVELLEGGDDACDFIVGDGATLLVSAELPAGECDPGTQVEVDGAGAACLVGGVPTATAATNEYAVGLTVTGQVAAEASRDALARLLPAVTPQG